MDEWGSHVATTGGEPSAPQGGPGPGTAAVVRGVDAGSYLESFLVWAVVALLVIRAFLKLTGYPQLGGGGLHIAHMLWGGLLMLVALVLTLSLLGHRTRHAVAFLGGIGFGTFIDELGKFITSDNDYFFQPTIMLIYYMLFVLLFFLFRAIESRLVLSPQGMLANGADTLVDGLVHGATREEVARGLALLAQSGSQGALVEALRQALFASPRSEDVRPPLLSRIDAWCRGTYHSLIASAWFQWGITALFVAHGLLFVVLAIAGILNVEPSRLNTIDRSSFAAIGGLVAALASSAMVAVGVFRLPVSRVAAYRWFRRAILVSILLVQVFLFYQYQLAAIGGLAADLIVLGGLNYALDQERLRNTDQRVRQREGKSS